MTEETKKEGTANTADTPSSATDADQAAGGAPSSAGGAAGTTDGPKKRRRRGKRGGRRHRKKTTASSSASSADESTPEDRAPTGDQKEKAPAPSSRRTSGARASTAKRTEPSAATDQGAEASPGADKTEAGGDAKGDGTTPGRRRGRRGGRGRGRGGGGQQQKAAPSEEDTEKKQPPQKKQPERKRAQKPKAAKSGSTRLAARAQRRATAGRRPRRKLTEADAKRLRGGEKTMLIHEHEDRTQIAVLEEGQLIEHYVARRGQRETMAGNIYLGKVQNVLPGMEAAFVDFGRGRNGVLYAGEVNYSPEDLEGDAHPRIEHVLKSGQKLMVQVTKDPIGNKGARLTAQVSLAGRYLVLAPEQKLTGISRRLAENERTRLRKFLHEVRPDGHGVIVRTAADGASRESLERDLNNLLSTWEKVQKGSKRGKAPNLLYQEPDLIQRVVRDEFSDEFTKLVVDGRDVHEIVRSYLEETAPDLLPKLELHEGSLQLFEEFRVTEQLHKALERKVWLPSGGSIVIDRSEALTVIDVNTGKFTGKGSTLEDTVTANNIEAAGEIARQLRLRDIGGIIVIDFIDMIDPKNQQEVLRTLTRTLSKDKTRSQVFDMSNLGLVEMTRKKVSEGLLDAFSEPCPNCEGRGIVITHDIE